ncbi:MAG: hypothetical protein P4L92_06515 [Rudaea sp.]|nr:hypothetical protein [Rudaea sp.]
MPRAHKASRTLLCIFLCLAGPVLAQVSVPSTATFALNGGSLDLAGTDLQVAGSFSLASGSVQNAANVAIAPGGDIDGGSGTITLFGNWSNLGSFAAGASQVNFIDGAQAQSSVTGNTTFFNLSFASTIGKAYVFQGGSAQAIEGQLQILGTSNFGIQFQSAIPAQFASINLLNGGSQNIDFVGVSNVHATGQHLAPTLTNDGGSGNAVGWFGQGSGGGPGSVAPTPVLSPWALLLLALGLLAFASTSKRRFIE